MCILLCDQSVNRILESALNRFETIPRIWTEKG